MPTPGSIPVHGTNPAKVLDTTVVKTSEGEVHREVVTQGDPTDANAYAAVLQKTPGIDAYGGVVRPILNTDAFGRLRVSNPATLFDSQFQYDKLAFIWDEDTTGSGSSSHNANGAYIEMDTTTANGDEVIRQTYTYHRYQPGKSQLVVCTFDLVEAITGVRKRIGYFDADNGVFFEEDGGACSVVRRSKVSGSVVDTSVAQASWNIDAMDGSGPSGITLDPSKSLIWWADLEWLGVGTVRVGFVINGVFYIVHAFHHSNLASKTYMTTANLPLRYQITNTSASSSAGQLLQICSTVMSEGGFAEDSGLPFAASNGITVVEVNGRRPVMSIRPKATFNSIVNRGQMVIDEYAAFAISGNVYVELVHGGTLTGASFASVDADSIAEFDVAATGINGGHVIEVTHVAASAQGSRLFSSSEGATLLSKIPMALDIGGNQVDNGNLTIVATSMDGGEEDVVGHLTWKELR